MAEAAFGPTARAATLAAYRRGARGDRAEARQRLLTDTLFRIRAIRLAEAAAARRVYMYLLTWGSPPTGAALGAFHGLDLPFMWNQLDAAGVRGARRPSAVARFAGPCTGPGSSSSAPACPAPRLPDWPAYDPHRRATMLLDEPSRVVDDPLGEERRLWDGVHF